ncbi:MAG: Gfo/Idh/MocA family oxidoreductase [Micromonosporaceae bacterium]
MRTPTRVLVCGTRFGQVYLEAFRGRFPEAGFELAGILAAGSERSQACARRYGVPLFTDVDQVPDDVDIACVVLRGKLLGGRGSQIAQALMARGIHVLQEHPVHGNELAECLRVARRHRVVHHLNTFYVHTTTVRRFLAAARALLASQPVRYVDASCGFQLAYSLLDILGQVLGGIRPWAFGPPPDLPARITRATTLPVPFRSLDGVLAGVPTTLRVQNQMDPADPDNYAHLMHQVSIGVESGALRLVGTHGPIVWTARPEFPREVAGSGARPHFDSDVPLGPPSAAVLGPAQVPSYPEVFATVWPAGVRRALLELRRAATGAEDPMRRGQYHLSLCQLWQDLTVQLGPPELLDTEPAQPLAETDFKAVREAAEGVTEH